MALAHLLLKFGKRYLKTKKMDYYVFVIVLFLLVVAFRQTAVKNRVNIEYPYLTVLLLVLKLFSLLGKRLQLFDQIKLFHCG